MGDFWLAALGLFAFLVVFLFGFFLGMVTKKRDSVGGWLRKHGCFVCQEKYQYSLRGEIEDAFEDE